MSDTTQAHWRTDRPAEGFYTTELPALPDRPVRTFLPTDYQPRYPYPLVVAFHAAGGTEENGSRLLPRMSRRNYIGLSLRGPHPDGRGFGWADADADGLTDYLLAAVEQTRRTYHVHSERVFLLGVGDGATAAYRVGLRLADRVAGVIALNGLMPKPAGKPLFCLRAVRGLPVFIGHGVANPVVPYATAERDFRLLYAAGADVKMTGYPTSQKLHAHMLRDANRWIMGGVTAGRSVFARSRPAWSTAPMPDPVRPTRSPAVQGFLAFLGIGAAMFVGFLAAGGLLFAGAPFWLVPVVMFGTPIGYVGWLAWRGVRKLRDPGPDPTPQQEAARAALPVLLPLIGAFLGVAVLSFGGVIAAVALEAPGWVVPVVFLGPFALLTLLAGPALKALPDRLKRLTPSPERIAVQAPIRPAEPVVVAAPEEFPTVPDDPSTDGTRLARRLPAADLPAGCTCLGCLAFALFWNGIVSVFVWQAVKGFVAGKPEWFLVVFLIPFVLVGLGLVAGVVFAALTFVESLLVGTLVVEVDAHPFAPGGRYAGHVRQSGLFRLSQVGVALVCSESATYQAGTTESTDTKEVARQPAELPEPQAACPTDFTVAVPADAMHSFEAKKNKIVWKLTVGGRVLGALPYARSFQVVVRPGAEHGG